MVSELTSEPVKLSVAPVEAVTSQAKTAEGMLTLALPKAAVSKMVGA